MTEPKKVFFLHFVRGNETYYSFLCGWPSVHQPPYTADHAPVIMICFNVEDGFSDDAELQSFVEQWLSEFRTLSHSQESGKKCTLNYNEQ